MKVITPKESLRDVNEGIFKLTYVPTGEYYISSTNSIKDRIYSLKRSIKIKDVTTPTLHKFTKYYNQDGNFDNFAFEILSTTEESDLAKTETRLRRRFKQHVATCINMKVGSSPYMRGKTQRPESNLKRSIAMIGKNTIDGIPKHSGLITLVSPEGKEYHNIINVAKFARKQGLSQSSLCAVINHRSTHCKGWHLPGVEPAKPKIAARYVTQKPVTVVSPSGHKFYNVSDLLAFEAEHKCKIYRPMTSKKFVKLLNSESHVGHGRTWYISGEVDVYVIRHKDTGRVEANIVDLGQFFYDIGLQVTGATKLKNNTQSSYARWQMVDHTPRSTKPPVTYVY